MGVFDSVERRIERAVNTAFAKTFRSGVQPVEIASALKREMSVNASVLSRETTLIPNMYGVRISQQDFDRIAKLGTSLSDQLLTIVQEYASDQHFQFSGTPSVKIQADPSLSPGLIEIDTQNVATITTWTPFIFVGHTKHQLRLGNTVFGRGSDADITLPDSGMSRKHCEIHWDGTTATLRDLGSTNGSILNSVRTQQAVVPPDSHILIGETVLTFKLVPHTTTAADDVQLRRNS